MGIVTSLPQRAARAEEPQDPPSRHVTLPAAARNAMTSLTGKVGALERIFAGPSTTREMAAQIEAITKEIRAEAERIARFSR